ncbi:hypothetical protein DLAC_07813 [Tieghemostelium lacteum]|uniref:PB1 domain-containing protein n=1 Tax=Tieghemostelium lacteum TaxID=361077 RepID=A0A151ZAG5_TIELA|nr:hypothetical protein DLAC_07813 [Tieghemostelium lacteum]|eukprot:KYQ90937.1 hypothetical protein DLAC_07813 [Tieghemostelium lacteum]
MGDSFFKSFLGGGSCGNTSAVPEHLSIANPQPNNSNTNNGFHCYFSKPQSTPQFQQQNTVNEQQQQQPQQSQQNTKVNISVGNDNKSVSIPKNSSYKDLTTTIKDMFGMNNKSTLCIKYENKNGDMLSVATDCQLKKAYRQTPSADGGDSELRLVVKEVNKKCEFNGSLFSYFFGKDNKTPENALNFTANASSPAVGQAVSTPDFLKAKDNDVMLDANLNAIPSATAHNNHFNNHHSQHQSQLHNSGNNISFSNSINNSHINYSPLSGSLFKPISFSPVINNNKQSNMGVYNSYSTSTTSKSATVSIPVLNSKLSSSPKQTQLKPTCSSSITTTTPTVKQQQSPTIQSKKEEEDSKLNRNFSFDFNMDLMDDDSSSSISSKSSTPVNNNPMDNQQVVEPKSSNSGNITPPIMPQVCSKQFEQQQGQCKEVSSFMCEITKLFCVLQTTNNPVEQTEIKQTICDKIQNTLKTMPWILGVFPQLTRFVSQNCPFSVPPNTPPPSPSQVSPLLDMTTKGNNYATVHEINKNSSVQTVQSQITLQNSIDSNSEQPQQSPSKSMYREQGPIVNKGTRCSICLHSPIIGPLYKCVNCEKFMFCDFCKFEKSSIQCTPPNSTHQIILISSRLNQTNQSTPISTSPSNNNINNNSLHNSTNSCNNNLINNNNSNNNNNNNSNCIPVQAPIRGCPYQRKQFKCTYNVKFLSDITLPLGSYSTPGQNLVKTWKVMNMGPSLPSDCLLVRVCGNTRLSKPPSINVSSFVPTGEQFMISIPFTVPHIPPQCSEYLVGEYWRFCTADGVYFGDKLWLSLIIKNDQQQQQPSTTTPTESNTKSLSVSLDSSANQIPTVSFSNLSLSSRSNPSCHCGAENCNC